MKILLAVNGSACSEAAAREVARRPWPQGSRIRVISVVEPAPLLAMPDAWGPPTDYYEVLEEAAQGRAQAAIEKAVGLLRAGSGTACEIEAQAIPGLPKEVIIHEADRWGSDLIVVGSHGYRGLVRFWLGSVSHAVAAHAHCSVQIVRCGETGPAPGGSGSKP